MKTYQKFKNLLGAGILAFGISACSPKIEANLTIPIYQKPTEKPFVKPQVLQPLKVVVDEIGIAQSKNYYISSLEGITNQQPYLKTSVPLTNFNLYKKGTKEIIAQLEKVGENTYQIKEGSINTNRLEIGTIALEKIISGEIFNESEIEKRESSKKKCLFRWGSFETTLSDGKKRFVGKCNR